MATVDTTKVCLFTQQMMDAILGRNDPNQKRRAQLGFTNALISASNTAGFEQIVTGIPRPVVGGARVLSVYYRRPDLCQPVLGGEANVCQPDEGEAPYPYTDQLVTVDEYNHVIITLNRQTYQDACEGLTEELAKKTIDAAYALLINENQYFITKYIANLCAYANGDSSAPGSGTEQTVKLFNDIGQPNAMSMFKVKENYTRLGYGMDTPIVVGGTGIAAWAMAQGIFQGNLDGFDVTRIPFNMPTFVDYEYDTIAGLPVKRMATWMPGSIQRLTWLKFQPGSEFRIVQPQISKTTITVDGEVFDYSIHDDGCNDYVTVTLGRGYDLFVPDATVYDENNDCERGGCPRQNWVTDCADLDCSDTINA